MSEIDNKRFSNAVTSMAFNLSLSRNMIIALAGVAGHADRHKRDVFVAFGGYDTAVTSGRALKERGLVRSPNPESPGIYELTDAGKHVVELLKIAGIIEKVEVVNDQCRKARK